MTCTLEKNAVIDNIIVDSKRYDGLLFIKKSNLMDLFAVIISGSLKKSKKQLHNLSIKSTL